MKNTIIKRLYSFGLMAALSFLTLNAAAQCDPVVQDRMGQNAKTATYCVGELVPFKANSPGHTTTIVWTFGDNQTSSDQNPNHSYTAPGTYTVNFDGTGGNGNCNQDLTVIIKPSPDIFVHLVNSDIQCFEGNDFCFIDTTKSAPGSSIVRMTYLFSDGKRIDTLNPVFPVNFCYSFTDPTGGFFDLTIEAEDANGCVSRIKYSDLVYVNPRLGIEFVNRTPAPNPGCDSTLGVYENISLIPLANVKSFCWYWGDGDSTCGDSITNTDFWNGEALDGMVEHMYTTAGTFNGKLVVEANYGCTDSFVWKAAVTNIILRPKILADKDSSCTSDNPVCFSLEGGPPAGASAFLWTFGDPPSGPANFEDKIWDPCHAYGTGPWMITLRIIAGPCDVTVYDTIVKNGPSSSIEVPFDRVPEDEAYQCVIRDSVHFPNNSSFWHNDPDFYDEDSVTYYYDWTFEVYTTPTTGADSLRVRQWHEEKTGNKIDTSYLVPLTTTVTAGGATVSYNATKDSLEVTYNGNTTFVDKTLWGTNSRLRYKFNFTVTNANGAGAGDQTALPNADPQRGYDPNVWRVWDLGDRFAPQCTTDSRPWVNKNVGVNCNWTVDSAPVHWYTPWDDIYQTFQDGQFYNAPYLQTRLHKGSRSCYQVAIYPSDPMIVQGDTVLTVPIDSTLTYRGVTIPAGVTYPNGKLGNWIVKRPRSCFFGTIFYYDTDSAVYVAINNGDDTTYHNPYRLGENPIGGNTTWTVSFHDMNFDIPSGVTVTTLKLAAPGGGGVGVGTSRTIVGPTTVTIEADEQFTVQAGDSIKPRITIEENASDTTFATASGYLVDTVIFGVPTTVTNFKVFVDSALHREQFFLENGQCFSVTLWHQDTIHPLMCESEGTKSLALIPPSAKGLEWTEGIPCPLDGDNLSYFLTFDMGETKPGCTQQWFAVNFDSIADPGNFVPFNSGGVLAPPPPGSPLPFILGYQLTGSYGNQFVKGYTPGEIGNDPALRSPNGSFTIGLIVGNGAPDPNGGPPECLDTFWYSDMFRILYLNADFTIVSPQGDPKTICAGETAYFLIDEPIQDSIKTLRWAWGYQGLGRGPQLDIYIEQFEYYQEYEGPSPSRNDANVTWSPSDKWLYNYVIRQELTDIYGLVILDTIVTTIIKDWRVVANTRNADQLVKDAFEQQLGLYYGELPEEDIPYYLGDGTFGCLDTTGLSQFFTFGVKAYSEKVDKGVFVSGDTRYRIDTTVTPHDTIEVAKVLHFRDSSIRGYDSLAIDTNFDGNPDMIHGVWRKDYRYPKIIVPDPCYPNVRDTLSLAANGPMIPSLFLNNTVGCEKRGARLLNVGFLNDFWLDNENICNGLTVNLEDTLRYWQYGEVWPEFYPIDPNDYWHTPARYLANIEIFEGDWDSTDGVWDGERSLTLNHIYDTPGEYTITVVSKDSMNCRDTVYVTAFVSDIIPQIGLKDTFLNCNWIVNFNDSSEVIDPCALKDTCTTGVDLSCDSIIAWHWDFGDGTRTSILKNPSHDYTQGGWFDVKLTVWSHLGCVDSVVRRIFIPGPQPEFEFALAGNNLNDTAIICVGDSIDMKNISGGTKLSPAWEMYWGDGGISNPQDSGTFFGHRYDSVGTFSLSMIQFDEIPGTNIRCNRIFPDTNPDLVTQRKIIVIVRPIAPVSISSSKDTVCPNEVFTVTAVVDSPYTQWQWVFTDLDTISQVDPYKDTTFSYATTGLKDIRFIPFYTRVGKEPVCSDTTEMQVYVTEVIANFDIDSINKPEYCFTNTSTNATVFDWTFQDEPGFEGTSTEENPCHDWSDRIGTWEVCLAVESPEGCLDTVCQTISNTFLRTLIPYNIFTPDADQNGDGLNDSYVIEGKGLDMYNIKIYNRWGERVFESESIDLSWNGKVNNTGNDCPEGTYFYIINYKFNLGEENEGIGPIEGTVTLQRERP